MAKNGIYWTDKDLLVNLDEAPDRFDSAMIAFTEFWSHRVQGEAQTNARWQDQTGNARQGLTARPEHTIDTHSIVLFHRMPYGIWLETRWSGRYAIIMPTIRTQGRHVMRSLRELMRAM